MKTYDESLNVLRMAREQAKVGDRGKLDCFRRLERFVRAVIDEAGMESFNRIWVEEANLPRPEEIEEPGRWIARVAGT